MLKYFCLESLIWSNLREGESVFSSMQLFFSNIEPTPHKIKIFSQILSFIILDSNKIILLHFPRLVLNSLGCGPR